MRQLITKFTILLGLSLIAININAQYSKVEIDKKIAASKKLDINPVKSDIQTQVLSAELEMTENQTKWNRKLVNFEKKHEIPENIKEVIQKQTDLKLKNKKDYYPDENDIKSIKSSPNIGTNFEGNWFGEMTPPDNTLAISNGGYIVTVVNQNIEYYNTSGALLYTSSFDDFFNEPSFTSILYDPVVLYDSGSDRFFMVVLHGTTSSTSKVLACFSQTNNPLDGWYVYYLSGNPLNDLSWCDRPEIGVSTNEVYITGNLFGNSGSFKQALIYQLDKYDGYNGNPLDWRYWHNISNEPFNIVPASYGQQGNYGPGIFLISTDEDFVYTDKYRLFDLTDDMSGNPQLNVYSIDADFSLAGNALQLGTPILLHNGDNRGLSAFYLNGILHFVFHSEYINAYNGINYNRLTVSTLTNWNSIFGVEGYDYSYPSLASFGTNINDKSVMVCVLRSSSTIYPEIRVINCDNAGDWSGSSLVKSGETYVDYLSVNSVTRWGDYSGTSRKQNASTPEVWLSGGFGKYRNGEHAFDTWIAQITGVTVGIDEQGVTKSDKYSIFPNPVYDMFNVEFTLENDSPTEILLTDINGKIVKILYNDKAKKGRNQFSFNKDALSAGVYLLTINSNSKTLKNEKIIIK